MTRIRHVFHQRLLLSISIVFLLVSPTVAQSEEVPETPPQITAANITQLESVATIDFADYPELGEMATGWFIANNQGDLYAFADTYEQIFVASQDGIISTVSYGDVQEELGHSIIDMKFNKDETILVSLIQINLVTEDVDTGEETMLPSAQVTYHAIEGETAVEEPINQHILRGYSARAIWLDQSDGADLRVYVEATDVREPEIRDVVLSWTPFSDDEWAYNEIPYAPGTETEPGVRIGRIVPPKVVTSTFEGLVKLWNLETGEIVAEAQIEGGSAVFGQINDPGTYFAWRGPASEHINLLNFETGENQVVAPLDGEYFNWFFVSHDASLILGVTPEERPEIVAWIVETGERILVGEYRECSRHPDMVRLSKDGTTLVIGCDTGLDIWRINAEL